MEKRIESTITWYVKRTGEGIPPLGKMIGSLMQNHKLSRTEAEDALIEYEQTHYGAVPHGDR